MIDKFVDLCIKEFNVDTSNYTSAILTVLLIVGMILFIINIVIMFILEVLSNGHIDIISEVMFDYFTPSYLCYKTKMNMFSCAVVSLILIIINYLYCIPVIMIKILYFITHIGRKK